MPKSSTSSGRGRCSSRPVRRAGDAAGRSGRGARRGEHVGSTAVPGSLTKGDLAICVIVEDEEFEPASRVLADCFQIHQPENWSPTLASFTAPSEDGVEVGVQLVPTGSPDERAFVGWRDRLCADPELRVRYDELKRCHRADGSDAYRAAKERLIVAAD